MDCSLPGSLCREFSRQECWSDLPFPSSGDLPNLGIEPGSPTLEVDSLPSEPPNHQTTGFTSYASKVKESESRSVVSNSLPPHELYSIWNSPGHNTGMGSLSLLQGIFPTQGLNPGLLPCRWILYQLSQQGKSKNTGVGSLSLLQGIFPIQKLNWGLLHCWWVLYRLSYQGSPMLVRLYSTSFKLDFSST